MPLAGNADFARFSISSLGFASISLSKKSMELKFINKKDVVLHSYDVHNKDPRGIGEQSDPH